MRDGRDGSERERRRVTDEETPPVHLEETDIERVGPVERADREEGQRAAEDDAGEEEYLLRAR